jgi:hypothetical protein
MVEDAEKSRITRIYSLVIVCGQLSALFAPISFVLVSHLTLVKAIRILYINRVVQKPQFLNKSNAFVVMTIKLILLFRFSKETKTGLVRIKETQGKSILSLIQGYGDVLQILRKSKGTIFALIISGLVGTVGIINTTFWQVLVSKKLLVPDPLLPLFPMFRSILSLVFFFTVIPHITKVNLKIPLLLGFTAYLLGQTILVLTPTARVITYGMLGVSLVFDGFGVGILAMLAESLVALQVNAAERARVMAIQHMLIMVLTAPFGWIGGILSGISRDLPFVLTSGLLLTGFLATLGYYLNNRDIPS